MIKIPEFIESLQPYKAGKPISELAREQNLTKIVKLASNENPLGPSPKAMEAIKNGVTQLHRYADPLSHELVQAIAKKYKVQPNHVICGHGTDSLIAYIVGAFCTEGDEVLTSEGTFIGIYVSTRKQGRKLVQVPMKDYGYDLQAILEGITDKTRIIYLANPNNPTGTLFEKDEFEAFMEKVPSHILVILDEAYTAYVQSNPQYPDGVHYDYENMVVMRTLSKAYGLGGLRIGFAVGPDQVIEAIKKIKLPFEPNYLAQIGGMAALEDDAFLEQTVQLNKESLARLSAGLRKLGIEQVQTWANFILMLFPDETTAESFTTHCMNKGLILRHVKAFGVPNGVRINSGTMEETDFALEVMAQVLSEIS